MKLAITSSLTILASGLLTLNNDINLGTGNLDIGNPTRDPDTLDTGSVTLGGNVTLTAGIIDLATVINSTTGNHNLTIMANSGGFYNNINLGGGAFTLSNTNTSGTFSFSVLNRFLSEMTIQAGSINFARNGSVAWVLEAASLTEEGRVDLTLRATGDITFRGTAINLGFGRLEMSADNEGNAIGTIVLEGTPVITAGSLLMRHAAAFPADFMADTSAVTGEADLRFTAVVTQAIHPWMNLGGTSFTLRGEGAAVLTAITIGETTLNYGTTDIDLQAAAITLTAATTLTGGAISLTGALTAANLALTITASGLLTLNDDITLGTGILTITAGDRINVPTSIDIIAMASNIRFTDRLVQSDEVGFTPAGSTTSTLTQCNVYATTPTYAYIPPPCAVGEADLLCWVTGSADLIVDPLLEASASITINAGTNALTFGGEGAITITAPTISITAGSIDIGSRTLTITAAGAGGTITLVGVTSITGTGAGAVSLAAATIVGLSTALTVNVPSISLAQNTAFGGGDTAPFTFGMAVTSLTIEDSGGADIAELGWRPRANSLRYHDIRCADLQ